jgi:hypothetical protein
MKIPIITNAQDAEIRKFVMERSWHADSPKQCIDDAVQAFKISRDKAKAIVRDMYDKDTFPDLEAGASSRYPEDVENALGVEVPITTGTSIVEDKQNARVVVPGDFVEVSHGGEWQPAKVVSGSAAEGWSVKLAKTGDTVTVKDVNLKKEAGFRNDDMERVENPSWMRDEGVWEAAKKAVGKKGGEYNWPEVTAVYKKMGGRIK